MTPHSEWFESTCNALVCGCTYVTDEIELLWDLMVRESSRMRPANKKAVVVQEGERGAVTRDGYAALHIRYV
jgi:hypothetical protein